MDKLDLKKTYKELYAPSAKRPAIVDVPEFKFITLSGAIEKRKTPGNSPEFSTAIETLYSIAYTVKFMSKKNADNPIDFTVMPLEGLWWVEGGKFDINIKDNWHWQLILMQPEHISKDVFNEAVEKVSKKKEHLPLDKVDLISIKEGKCVQVIHLGPYSEEPASVERLRIYAEEQGYEMLNDHHEIYIGDPRKSKPEKLKTILRHKVKPI